MDFSCLCLIVKIYKCGFYSTLSVTVQLMDYCMSDDVADMPLENVVE